jgi:hypothetical protein
LDYADADNGVRGIPELNGALYGGRQCKYFHYGIESKKEHADSAQDTTGPNGLTRARKRFCCGRVHDLSPSVDDGHVRLPAADGGDDRDFGAFWYWRLKTAREANVLVTDEDVDVIPDLALFRRHAVPDARVIPPEAVEGFRQGGGSRLDYDYIAAGSEGTQGARQKEGDAHQVFLRGPPFD